MRFVSIIFTIILFVLALGLALSNTQPTDLRFFTSGDEYFLRLPLVVLLVCFFIVGVAVGMLSGLPSWLCQKREILRLRRQVRTLEERKDAEAVRSVQKSLPALPAVAQNAPRLSPR